MKPERHSPDQIISGLREADALLAGGATIAQVCQKLGVAEATFHRRQNQYGGRKAYDAERLQELERENARLKYLVAKLSLDNAVLKELGIGKTVSPARKRRVVEHLEEQHEVSQRRACRVVGQPRPNQRYVPQSWDDEPALVKWMHEPVRQHPRYGYRRIWVLLGMEGWRVNRKRIWRLWRREGFKVAQQPRKKWRLGHSRNSIVRPRPRHKDHVWSWDFTTTATRRVAR